MRSLVLALALALALPSSSLAQAAPPSGAPAHTGFVLAGGLGIGGELGLDEGEDATLLEAEFVGGYEFESSGVRPELGIAFGFQPDGHVALRPGVRWTLPSLPVQLRAAVDLSNSREKFRLRWLLLGAAFELRLTSTFGLFAAFDTGAPIGDGAGLPLLVRGGAAFHL